MGTSLYLLVMIIFIFIGVVVLIARANQPEDAYPDINIESWQCPDCGFHVQAGDTCIYCQTKKV